MPPDRREQPESLTATGPAGAAPQAGTFSASDVIVIDGPTTLLAPVGDTGDVGTSLATCPTGDTVISGGYAGDVVAGAVDYDQPVGNSWEVIAGNDASIDTSFRELLAGVRVLTPERSRRDRVASRRPAARRPGGHTSGGSAVHRDVEREWRRTPRREVCRNQNRVWVVVGPRSRRYG